MLDGAHVGGRLSSSQEDRLCALSLSLNALAVRLLGLAIVMVVVATAAGKGRKCVGLVA